MDGGAEFNTGGMSSDLEQLDMTTWAAWLCREMQLPPDVAEPPLPFCAITSPEPVLPPESSFLPSSTTAATADKVMGLIREAEKGI